MPRRRWEKNWQVGLSRCVGGVMALLYPPRCRVCSALLPYPLDSGICSVCSGQVAYLSSPLCLRCGRQLEAFAGQTDHHCGECLKQPPPFDSACSQVHYRQPVQQLLHRLKYRGDTTVCRALAALIQAGRLPSPRLNDDDRIIPVPLFAARLRARGMNQAQILASLAFPEHRRKIAVNLLVRIKNTSAQTGLSGKERRKNLQSAFAVADAGQVKNVSVWLVDDVYTTGTTVSECSRTLKKAGAASVHVWTFARA